jgi:hypothetical protein
MRLAHASTAIFSFVGVGPLRCNHAIDRAWMRVGDARKDTAMKLPLETIRTIQLDYDQIWVFDGGRDARLRVLHGSTWLTEEGAAADAVVCAGSEVPLHAGRTLVEALGPTRLELVERTAPGTALRSALARWRSALRRAVARLQLGAPAGSAGTLGG